MFKIITILSISIDRNFPTCFTPDAIHQDAPEGAEMHKIRNNAMFLTTTLLLPAPLWATRGSDDYGIVMALMAVFFALPVGLTLLLFIIYSTARLRSKKRPDNKSGNVVFILSLVAIPPAILIPALWMHWADWKYAMIELMLAVFLPVLLMAIISAVLAMYVKKRSAGGDSWRDELPEQSADPSIVVHRGLSDKHRIGAVLLLIALLLLLFWYFFT